MTTETGRERVARAETSAVRVPERGGMAWRHFGDFRCMLVSPQLLLLQVAHPVVGAGVEQHSEFRSAPWPRLWNTLLSLSTVIYGGRCAAEAEARRLIDVHRDMKGVDDKGRRYHALNPEAYHWVHATLVMGAVDAHRLFGKGMTSEQVEAYYQEMRDVGRVWGLKDHHVPADWPAFVAYYDRMLAERLEMNQSVRDVLDELTRPQKPPVRWVPGLLWKPFGALAAHYALLVNVGSLSPALRERFGLTWTDEQERSLRRFARITRILVTLVPPPLRVAGSMFIAYWSTHRPGTDPGRREPLGAS